MRACQVIGCQSKARGFEKPKPRCSRLIRHTHLRTVGAVNVVIRNDKKGARATEE